MPLIHRTERVDQMVGFIIGGYLASRPNSLEAIGKLSLSANDRHELVRLAIQMVSAVDAVNNRGDNHE